MGYPMNIGEAAQAAGVTAKMIRHYERLGLIPAASRTDAGYRQYSQRDVAVLRFVRQCRSMGFAIKQIETLLGLWADSGRESRQVKGLAREHIAELERKMAEMALMKATLERIASDCHGDQRADCPILSRLAGDAAAPPAPAPAPVAPKRSAGKASVAARSQRMPQVPAPHAGLSAWMQGLATMRA